MKLGFYALVTLSAWASAAFAGSASGGGGDVKVEAAQAIYPFQVRDTVKKYTAKILIPYLYGAQAKYLALKPSEQAKSPLSRFFDVKGKSVFETIRETSVEVKMDAPCFDDDKKATDGSIHAAAPHSICISAKTISAKLARTDAFEAKIIALVAHEYSHLFGASEAEADQIQANALETLRYKSFDALSSQLIKVVGAFLDHEPLTVIPSPMSHFREFVNARKATLQYGELEGIEDRVLTIFGNLTTPDGVLRFIPPNYARLIHPTAMRFVVSKLFLSSLDPGKSPEQRRVYSDTLDALYNGREEVLALDVGLLYSRERYCHIRPDLCFSKGFWEVKIRRPRSIEDARKELLSFNTFTRTVEGFVEELNACGDNFGQVGNCPAKPSTALLPRNYTITGSYNKAKEKASCTGYWAWPHLRNTQCRFEGSGVKADAEGFFRFPLENDSFPWYCRGTSLDELECVQPMSVGA